MQKLSLHLYLLSGPDCVSLNAVELAQFADSGMVSLRYLRQRVAVLYRNALSAAVFLGFLSFLVLLAFFRRMS